MDFDLLKYITETPGAPGFEDRIRAAILKEVKPLVDKIEIDNIGNLYCLKRGTERTNPKRLLIPAHMDEIGFMVKHIENNGFLRFAPLGGFDPKTLTSQRVVIHGKEEDIPGVMSSKPVHAMDDAERKRAPKLSDFCIDTGLTKKELQKIVSVGDSITRQGDLVRTGHFVTGKSLDNRIAVYILLEVLKSLSDKTIPYDLYATFTVQEEVGLRGAHVAGHKVNPDWALNLDTTVAFDMPQAQAHEEVTRAGKGTAIKVADGASICNPRMVSFLRETAEAAGISYQHELLERGGTDIGGVARMAERGVIIGALSLPTRNLHQTVEMIHTTDIDATISLTVEAVRTLDRGHWTYGL